MNGEAQDVSRETFDRERFATHFDVSRETLAKFDVYAALLVDWQARMNLVGPATLVQVWHRHFADSAQLSKLGAAPWIDLGAGAGFPGLVLALLGDGPVTLVEATAKKADFLRAVIDATGAAASVCQARIEALPAAETATIAARACAPLVQLFEWGLRFAGPATRWVLPKGARVAEEIAVARKFFAFDAELIPSLTDPHARIVVATNVRPR